MVRVAYVNGRFLPHTKATVHIEDRGLQFADAVYEVIAVFGGRPLDLKAHHSRLVRSLRALSIVNPLSQSRLERVLTRLIKHNRVRQGLIYLQITRGVAAREHVFPSQKIQPTVIMTSRSLDVEGLLRRQKKGVSVLLVPENRWARPDIKSTSLLGNVLVKQRARQKNCFEAVYITQQGFISEGASSNIWMVTKKGEVKTWLTRQEILAGITRDSLRSLLRNGSAKFSSRPFRVKELLAASEVFLTSTSSLVTPIVRVSGHKIGTGKPGPITQKLIALYWQHVHRQTGFLLSTQKY